MNGIRYAIKIRGLKTPEGAISLVALREVSDALLHGSERALRLSVEGASVRRGKIPRWLNNSLEFVITGISKGSTVLEVEAPTLAQAAPERVRQQNLWYTLPNPEDTAISLLSKSVLDATSGQLESEYYDRGVLSALLSFRPILKKYLDEVEVDSQSKPGDNFKMGREQLEKISQMKAETPEPRAIVIAGSFNLIEHTPRRFQLGLEDGRRISGVVVPSFITEELMRTLWGAKVTVKGTAHFNPSSKMRFIEAQMIKPFEPGEEVFQNIPEPKALHGLIEQLKRKQEAKSPLMEIWGQWPGEESIEQILSVLKEISAKTS